AVITWATTNEELEELQKVENITIMQPEADVNNIYKLTKVFLMPSLWGEAFGQVVVEAMLRGIPVISSNVGGLIEAKQGLDYILPVNPIKEYISQKELLVSVHRPVVPEQNLEPWIIALDHLLTDREKYESLSRLSREKATEFYSKLGFDAFEEYFKEVIDKGRISETTGKESVTAQEKVLERINMLSPEKREQLYELYRLKGGRV
ncbi:MAG TPA: glycosyltransferase, partial [Lachnospiraceae bacterium]|nr:glycosyltransferase [Lachnospiraceae bacterium]